MTSKIKGLSSTELNSLLKGKEYSLVLRQVMGHFSSRPNDHVSACKFITALAFHVYHNPPSPVRKGDGVAGELGDAACAAFSILSSKSVSPEVASKASTGARDLLFRGFLRAGCLEVSLKLSASVGRFYRETLNSVEMVSLLTKTENLIRWLMKMIETRPQVESEVRTRLKNSTVHASSWNYSTMVLAIRRLRLHVLYVASGSGADDGASKELTANLGRILKDVLSLANEKISSISVIDSILIIAAKHCENLLAATTPDKLSSELPDLLASATSVLKNYGGQVTPRAFSLYCTLFEENCRRGQQGGSKEIFTELLAVAEPRDSVTFTLVRAYALVGRLLVKYTDLQLLLVEEKSKISHGEEAEHVDDKNKTEADAVKEIGDINPYMLNLSLTKEEHLYNLADQALSYLQEVFPEDCNSNDIVSTTLPFSNKTVLTMLYVLSLFFLLLDFADRSLEASSLLLKLAKTYKFTYFSTAALGNILKLQARVSGKVLEAAEEVLHSLHSPPIGDGNQLRYYYFLLVPCAWNSYDNQQMDRASAICGHLIRAVDGLSMTSSKCLLLAETNLLLARIRLAKGSFVTYPACDDPQLPPRCGGLRRVMEDGPLEFVAEAMYWSSTVVHRTVTCRDLTTLGQCLKSYIVHREVLQARLEVCSASRLPLEMRLYAKTCMQFGQDCYLPVRTADFLLNMAEVDLMCDDPEQATAKLNSVRKVMGPSAFESLSRKASRQPRRGATSRNTLIARGPVVDHAGASPALVRSTFTIPSWVDHQDQCCCYECTNLSVHLVSVKYFTLLGVMFHLNGDPQAAEEHFDGVLDLIEVFDKKISNSLEVTRNVAKLTFARALQWQVECYGRDTNIRRCSKVLENQKYHLTCVPNIVEKNEFLRTEVCTSDIFLNITIPQQRRKGSPSPEQFMSPVPSEKAPTAHPPTCKTPSPPVQISKARVPRKPRKKLLPPASEL